MILSGCARSAAPSAGNQGYQLSRACEQLAQNVADPIEQGAVTVHTDPTQAVGEYVVALGEANDTIDATRTCQARQRERVAKGR